ncbi:sensor histidine kinase [Marinilactibacillus sp. Marseille-P9653]|uniref:sensor histidine kinase n=1 Tax=Marinilactibacillus sp. Marseille-P9653 TaxID=2866583 RepID=UPI001CE48B2D|nr:histidine kinase [Marinilactibacillus sp. Marseille-P9653]
MINYWIYFILLTVTWISALFFQDSSVLGLFYSVLFFAGYNLIPLVFLFLKKVFFIGLLLCTVLTFISVELNPFVWLILVILAAQFYELLKPYILYCLIVLSFLIILFPAFNALNSKMIVYQLILVGLSILLIGQLNNQKKQRFKISLDNTRMYNELSSIKRQQFLNDESIRLEERSQIAREIHDAVGHRLTALLMQLEVARLQAKNKESAEQFNALKKLAQMSLSDTRKAVSTLKSQEQSGLQAVIFLIRKLETESHLRLTMTLKSGVLNSRLNNEQSVTLYRAIQEALTNMMKHSDRKRAEIVFEIIAERELKFSVKHIQSEKVIVKEGFGLSNMKERLERIDGKLSIQNNDNHFIVIGQFPLEVKQND